MGWLRSKEDKRTASLVNSLGTMGDARTMAEKQLLDLGAEALPELVKGLNSADQWVIRSVCAQLLGKLKDRRAVDPLLRATHDSHWAVVEAATIALGEIRDPLAVDRLRELLGYSTSARADLGSLDPRLAGISLPQHSAQLASIESEDVRKAAQEALNKFEGKGEDRS